MNAKELKPGILVHGPVLPEPIEALELHFSSQDPAHYGCQPVVEVADRHVNAHTIVEAAGG